MAENLLDLTLPYKLLVFTLLYVPNSSNFHMYVKAQYFRHMKMKFWTLRQDPVWVPPPNLHRWQRYAPARSFQKRFAEHAGRACEDTVPREAAHVSGRGLGWAEVGGGGDPLGGCSWQHVHMRRPSRVATQREGRYQAPEEERVARNG